MKTKKIGVLLGTFDPIHNGHLSIAEKVLEYDIDEVIIFPSYDAPHKTITSSNLDRLTMCQKAVENKKNITCSSLIIDKKLGGYDMSVMNAIQANHMDSKLFYILGSDIYKNILSWQVINDLVTLCDFMVILREEDHLSMCQEISQQLPNKTHLITDHIKSISSTHIKSMIDQQHALKSLLPGPVIHYITVNNLYKKN